MAGEQWPKDASPPGQRPRPPNAITRVWSPLIVLAVCCLGVSSVIVQVVLLREMLGAFCGNELVLGVILGNWMLLSGLGAWIGRAAGRLKRPVTFLICSQLLIGLLPIAQVLLLRCLRDIVFIRGAMIGLVQTIIASLVLLSPYCLISGFMLTLACRMLLDAPGIRKVYLADSAGSVAGGVLISFILLRWVDHIGALYVPALLNLLCASAVALAAGRKVLLALTAAAAVAAASLALSVDLEQVSTEIQYPSQKVLFSGSSPYGRIVVTESAGQINFIANGLPMASTDDVEAVEETVHYAMAQRPSARRVLLLGGGVSGTAKEILKYGVEEVAYVELDPLVINAARRFVPGNLNDGRIKVIIADARAFIRTTGESYDVIIVDVPDPSTSLLNRLYTAEFYRDAKKRLAPDGVLCFALGHYADRVSPQLARILATARGTVGRLFRPDGVLLIPGGRVFFLASDGPLYDDIASRIEQANVETKLVNRHYLAAMLTPDRLEQLRLASREQAEVNEDFSPVLYYYHLVHWTSRFESNPRLAGVVLLVALAIYLVRTPPVGLVIFASGLAATALEVVVLMGFQVLCGSVYSQLGMIVTAFMTGLVVGAFLAGHVGTRTPRRALAVLGFTLAAFAALLPLALKALGGITPAAGAGILLQSAISLLTCALAALVGMQFPLAARAETGSGTLVASRLYVADFVGACLGALLASALAVPLLGVTLTSVVTGGLCAAAGGILLLRRT